MFPTKILLATDGSGEAGRAARMAVGLSEKLGSELHIVHVAPLPNAYTVPEAIVRDPEFYERVREIAERKARERLDEEAIKVGSMGEIAGAHARIGHPAAEIVGLAEEIGAGLVVVGARGLGRVRRAIMGSVSTSVVWHAHCPALVVRGDGRAQGSYLPGKVLLALDGSAEGEAAKRAAVEISKATDSELHVLYVMQTEESLPYSHPLMRERWDESLERSKHRAREFVAEQAKRIEAEGAKVKDAHLVFGKPDGEIVKLGEEIEAGMVVVGSRGLGGIRRALMGSVSDSVVRHAHGPVLVVRSEAGRDEAITQTAEEPARA